MCQGVTQQQEAFLQGLIRGKSQRQAYIDAYPNAENWDPKSIDSRASNLLKNDKVLTRYEELKAEAREASGIKRDDIIQELSGIGFADIDLSKLSAKDKLRALELLVKILGYEPSEKMDISLSQKPKIIYHAPDNGRGTHAGND